MKRRLIALMLASGVSIGFTALSLAGCNEKTVEEKGCEEKIRQLLEYDAGIDINNDVWGGGYGRIEMEANNGNFFIIFTAKSSSVHYQKITYSVDKDFYYNFKNNFSTTEGQKEIDLINELTSTYNPIKIVVNNEERTI